MEAAIKPTQQKKKRDTRIQSVYSRCLLTRKIVLPITTIGKNLKGNIEENIKPLFLNAKSTFGFHVPPVTVNLKDPAIIPSPVGIKGAVSLSKNLTLEE